MSHYKYKENNIDLRDASKSFQQYKDSCSNTNVCIQYKDLNSK